MSKPLFCSYQNALNKLTPEQWAEKPTHDGPSYWKSLGITYSDSTKTRHLRGQCSCVDPFDTFVKESIAMTVEARVLLFDFEKTAGKVIKRVWDRGGLKDQYLFIEDFVEEPRVTMMSYKWLGEDETYVISEWDFPGETWQERSLNFAKAVWEVRRKATHGIAHNGAYADFPWLKQLLWWDHDLPPLPKWVEIDTKTLAAELKMPFKKLDDLAKRFGHVGKDGRFSIVRMDNALEGPGEDRTYLETYSKGDTVALEFVFHYLASRSNKRFNFWPIKAILGEICEKCGSDSLRHVDYVVPNRKVFELLQCNKCQAFQNGRKVLKVIQP